MQTSAAIDFAGQIKPPWHGVNVYAGTPDVSEYDSQVEEVVEIPQV